LQGQGKIITGYGDLAFYSMGAYGAHFVNVLLVLSQLSFGISYLIFIGENLSTIFEDISSTYIMFLCIPGLSCLVLFRRLSNLSPFAFIADISNLLGIAVVMCSDLELFREHEVNANDHTLDNFQIGIRSIFAVPYFFGIVMYCYEGIGVILTIHESMENKQNFNKVLTMTMTGVTSTYCFFGSLGYMAYGEYTNEIITLNLNGFAAYLVKVALSVGLYFTFPMMMFPIYNILENMNLGRTKSKFCQNVLRIIVVVISFVVSAGVPHFGDFISLVGAFACSTLAMVLPSYLHLKIVPTMSETNVFFNNLILWGGIILGAIGTINAAISMKQKILLDNNEN